MQVEVFHSKPRPGEVKTSVLQGNTALTDEYRHSLLIILFSLSISFHTISFLCVCAQLGFAIFLCLPVLLVTARSASAKVQVLLLGKLELNYSSSVYFSTITKNMKIEL